MLRLLGIFLVFGVCSANYNGPYLFWGPQRLDALENSALNGLDEELLKDMYTEASAIIIFVKNSSHPMTSEHYPSLENLLADRKSAYMTQSVLIYDPMDLNSHTEVIALSGTPEQEDIELCALFRDAEINYGDKKVMGILANSESVVPLIRQRREAEDMMTTTETPSLAAELNATEEGHIYYTPGKALFYTSDSPVLSYSDGPSYVLKDHTVFTVDYQKDKIKMTMSLLTSKDSREKIYAAFTVDVVGNSWYLTSVSLSMDGKVMVLPVIGTPPSATLPPRLTSYRCSARPLVFGNENVTLTMQNVQLQPKLNGTEAFGPAIDCVGFMTTPVLSGLFVSFICLVILGFSLVAILDIKTPNRFENSRSKQLTFTVQE